MFAKVSRVLVLTATVLAAMASFGPPGPVLAASPVTGDGGIVFTYHAPDAQAVFLAGDFNNWNAQDLAMVRQDSGDWTVSVALDPGTYEYKFIADGTWVEDPDNPEKSSDPFGGANSVVNIGDDGVLVSTAAVTSAAATAPASATSTTVPDDMEVGRPRAVEGGILFSYRDPDAGTVNLAGSFNGWNADQLPLINDGDGNWAIVHPLEQGEFEYKFVADGNWVADPENPDTKTDPYGGANSVVNVDSDGQLIAATESPEKDDGNGANTSLNPSLHLSGRYLTRFEFARNMAVDVGDDPTVDSRYRLQRPTMSVDLNFEGEVSELVSTYMRLRLDSDQNIIQNNVAGFLDEGNLVISPENFYMKAYWNQEVYTGGDLLQLGGNLDHEGTIFHDHLDFGKGSGGVLFDADPFGIKTVIYFANVHNQDYYGDPDLFDNTGTDKLGLRLSRKFGPFELGAPLWMERSLVWFSYSDLGSVPALDEHRAETGDTSDNYETETHNYNVGLDLRVDLTSKWMVGAQGNYVDLTQKFITGDKAGQDLSYGRFDIPILERDRRMYMGQLDFNPSPEMEFSLKYIMADMKGANPDQQLIEYVFWDQTVAGGRVYPKTSAAPATVDADSLDLTWDWHTEDLDLGIWVRRVSRDLDYGPVGQTVPEDSTLTSHTEDVLKASVFAGLGKTGNFLGHGEIEFAYTNADPGIPGMKADSYEIIFRYDRDLTRNTGLIADLRYIKYDYQSNDVDGNPMSGDPGYFAPFAGFRYTPIKQLELVIAYGVDPLDYSIDYSGRQMGRWWYRQNYLFDHPGATVMDAEDFLAEAQVFTLRAQFLF